MEKIIVSVSPVSLTQKIYIYSDSLDIVPTKVDATIDELPSAVTMSAAKYQINDIVLTGPFDYASNIQEKIEEKINTCFGLNNNIIVSLLKKGDK